MAIMASREGTADSTGPIGPTARRFQGRNGQTAADRLRPPRADHAQGRQPRGGRRLGLAHTGRQVWRVIPLTRLVSGTRVETPAHARTEPSLGRPGRIMPGSRVETPAHARTEQSLGRSGRIMSGTRVETPAHARTEHSLGRSGRIMPGSRVETPAHARKHACTHAGVAAHIASRLRPHQEHTHAGARARARARGRPSRDETPARTLEAPAGASK